MKKLLAILALLVALGIVAATAASSSAAQTPAAPVSFCVAGATWTLDPANADDADWIGWLNQGLQAQKQLYTWSDPTSGDTWYTFNSNNKVDGQTVTWTPITLSAGACVVSPPPPENNVFLCYSAYQNSPGVWPVSVAQTLIKQGYWSPYAVPGTVTGGTNVGDYHLTCNLASGQSASDATLGGAGEVYGSTSKQDVNNVPGFYPVVGK